MPFFEGIVDNNKQIIIDLLLNLEKDVVSINDKKLTFQCKGLLDTGANQTCISKKVVNHFNLTSEEQKKVSTPSNVVFVNQYSINFHLPISRQKIISKNGKTEVHNNLSLFSRNNLEVSELLNTPPNYDVLIGMDIIQELSINIFNKKYFISF